MVDVTTLGDKIVWIAGVLGAVIAIFAIIKKPIANLVKRKRELKDEKDKKLYEVIGIIDQSVKQSLEQNKEQLLLMDEFTKKLKDIENKVDANEIDRIRWEILNFANICKRQICCNADEFQHIFTLYDKYERLIEENGLKNGLMEVEIDFLRELYKKACDNGELI